MRQFLMSVVFALVLLLAWCKKVFKRNVCDRIHRIHGKT